MEKQEIIHKQVDEAKDSLEISTPAKGGALKIYGSFDDPEAFQKKIENAVKVREFAQMKLNLGGQ